MNIQVINEAERPRQPSQPLEFVQAGAGSSGAYFVTKDVYQPKGFITKFNKDGSAKKRLKQGRWVKKTVFVPLNKSYTGTEAVKE